MKQRTPTYPIDPMILHRYSSRAMSKELIKNDELMTLFEAARWAPSSYNNQPWRFLYAQRETPHWDLFFSLLLPANQVWAKNASTLVVLISRNLFEKNGKPSRCHSFDAGSAFENLALQGVKNGFVVHPMQGFDDIKAKTALCIPDVFSVEIMIAIGKPGKKDDLPKELAEKETFTERRPLSDIVIEGPFKE